MLYIPVFFFPLQYSKVFNLVKVFDKAKVHERNFYFNFFLSFLLAGLVNFVIPRNVSSFAKEKISLVFQIKKK